LSRVSGNATPTVFKSSFAIIIPTIFGLILFLIARLIFRIESRSALALFAVLTISAGTLGSYASFASGFYQDGGDYHQLQADDADMITGSVDYRALLVWLRDNSEKYDLVATNRYCSDSFESPVDCLALWSLTSAISGRQVLVEGLYPPNSQAREIEREKRRLLVDGFTEKPTMQGRSALLSYGVRWVVADFAVANNRNWGNFAEVRFENRAGAILELAP
jgi:hypothetical protein